jgi:hypothetical protein
MFLIAALQAGISYSVGEGPLWKFDPITFRGLVAALYGLRIALLLLLATLWVLNRKRALFQAIIAANAYFTLGLLLDVLAHLPFV